MNNKQFDYEKNLIDSLKSKNALIGIIGLGYVGLPLSLSYAEKGIKVLGFDIDKKKEESISKGISYLHHIKNERIKKVVEKDLLKATCDFSLIKNVDAIILCVPTPLNKYREPDLSFILNTMNSLLDHIKPGQVLSLESTTYPGTTDEILKPLIESKNLVIGKNFFLVYSPEREDPGNKKYSTDIIPKVLGGTTIACQKVGKELYSLAVLEVVMVSSTRAAEMTKLLENIHRAVNIGLVNELKPLADRMNIDLYEVIRAAATKPFGFVPYYPGPGLGGHCIPIDPFYLTWKAREFGMNTKFIELSGEINTGMPLYVFQKTSDALNDVNKSVKDSNILILGISYKKNVDDMRESPSVAIMKIFKNKGANIQFSDPFFKKFPNLRNTKFELESVELSVSSLADFDIVILATDHDQFDYELIKQNSKIIIDTRGKYKPSDKIIRG